MSTAPTVLLGANQIFRAVVRSETTDTATTVTPDDSGTLFVNLGTSTHTYTLPAVADGAGKIFTFFNGDGTATMAVASTAANFKVDDLTGTTCTSTTTAIGDCIIVIGDGTYYYGLAVYGSYTNA